MVRDDDAVDDAREEQAGGAVAVSTAVAVADVAELPAMAMFSMDADGCLVDANAAFAVWCEARPAAARGRPLAELLGPRVHGALRPHLESALDGMPAICDLAITGSDGAVRWLRAVHVPQFGGDGRVERVHAILADVTGPRRTEEGLRLLHELALVIGAATDERAALAAVVRTICEAGGWAYGEAWLADRAAGVLRPAPGWYPGHRYDALCACTVSLTRGEALPGRVWKRKRPEWVEDVADHTTHPRGAAAASCGLVSGLGVPVFSGEEVVAVLVFASDRPRRGSRLAGVVSAAVAPLGPVIERKRTEDALRESEERFREMAMHIREVFWLRTWPDSRPIYVSPAFATIWGRPPTALLDNPGLWIDAIHEDDRPRVRAVYLKDAAARGYEQEFRIVRPDGTTRWIRERGFPIPGSSGEVHRIAGIAEDITSHKLVEARVEQHQAELTHLTRVATVGELAEGIAHELNQPLAAIVNYIEASLIELRSDRGDPAAVMTDLREVATQAIRAAEIVRRLRTLVRREEPKRAPADLREVVHEALEMVRPLARRHGVTMRFTAPNTLPPLLVDRVQIQQVVLNLARNGIEAMEDAPLEQRLLTIDACEGGDDALEITIGNTGGPIPDDTAEHLFEPFFSTKPSGLGLGLAIAQRIVGAHGGCLRLVEPAEASIAFTFSLPVLKELSDD